MQERLGLYLKRHLDYLPGMHCIGAAMEQIQLGKQDVVFAGGGEELHWSQTVLFDAMGAMSSSFNETPSRASRPARPTR